MMTKADIETMVAAAVAKALANQASSKPSTKVAVEDKNAKFATKDASLKRTFTRRGIKDVTLLDRNDPTKPFNVKPYKAWQAEGRLVKKGEHGVKGLFHISQTAEV
jgi:hypothetical protein